MRAHKRTVEQDSAQNIQPFMYLSITLQRIKAKVGLRTQLTRYDLSDRDGGYHSPIVCVYCVSDYGLSILDIA